MENKEFRFIGIDNSGYTAVDFTGTIQEFAGLVANEDRVKDAGFPEEIINEYKQAIANGDIDEDMISVYQNTIDLLDTIKPECAVAVIDNSYGGAFEIVSLTDYNPDIEITQTEIEAPTQKKRSKYKI